MFRGWRVSINYLRYNLALAVGTPVIVAYLLNRYVSGKSRPGWRQRWGHLPDALRMRPDCRPRIWVHAVSAGEVVAAVPILRELRAALPGHELLLSVITPTGHEMAARQAAPLVDAVFYFPFDLPWVVRRVAEIIRPQVFVTLESELWPNLLHELKRQGASTVMVNGRISERNFARARRYSGGVFRWMLSNMDRLLMQSAADAERVRALGDLRDPGRVGIVGNSKFDQDIAPLSSEQVRELGEGLRLPAGAPVFVAGSTRSSEEEAEVVGAYLTMRARFPDLCLIIAPRQIDRADEVAAAMIRAGLNPVHKTRLAEAQAPVRHLVLDTMGELASLYAVADVVFVGNSFPPVVQGGGQNLLQPLANGKPVLFGPMTATIRSEAALACEARVGFRVQNGAALAEEGIRLLESETLRQEIAIRARELIAANRGVSVQYARAIAALADKAAPPFDLCPPAVGDAARG